MVSNNDAQITITCQCSKGSRSMRGTRGNKRVTACILGLMGLSVLYRLSFNLEKVSSRVELHDGAGATIQALDQQRPRISYTLHHGMRHNWTIQNPNLDCEVLLKGVERSSLPPALREPGMFGFSTQVATDLKILFMGDSVSMQYSQDFEESAGTVAQHRDALRYSWGIHEGLHVSAPVRGGGVVAGWRITGFLGRKGEGKPLPNSWGGGWDRSDVNKLTAYTYPVQVNATETQAIGSFDAMIFRIPHGWITLKMITAEALEETIATANELFGVSTIIFITLPFVNNVVTLEDLAMLKEKNLFLRDFVSSWKSPNTTKGSLENVLLLEFGRFADGYMEWNARSMGFDTSDLNYTTEKLQCCPKREIRHSIAQLCNERVPAETRGCTRNGFTKDGLHWCMNAVGGRLSAGISCLLGCVYNTAPATESTPIYLRECEKTCNDQFMSLTPVDDSLLIK